MNQKPTTDETFESQSVTPGTEKDNTEMAEDARSIQQQPKQGLPGSAMNS